MNYLTLTLLFLYGLIFGSFYNVVIYRMPLDISIVKGRSYCPKCQKTLTVFDLIPLFSFIFLGGKCRYCGEKISKRYPLVELFTGILFALSYIVFGLNVQMFLIIAFWSYLLIVSMIDIDHMFILDNINIFFSVIFVAFNVYILKTDVVYNLLAGLIAFLVYFAIHKISFAYYKREAFGLGDVFFIGIISFCLGLNVLYLTIFFPFIVAVFFFIIKILIGEKHSMSMEIPLAPFIAVSSFILSIYGEQMMHFIFLT